MFTTIEQLKQKNPNIEFLTELTRISDGKLFKVGDVVSRSYNKHTSKDTIIAFDVYQHPGYYDSNTEVKAEWQNGPFTYKAFKDQSFTMHRAIFDSHITDASYDDMETIKEI